MSAEYKKLRKNCERLILSFGAGEFVMSITCITDLIAVSLLGLENVAGYSLALSFIGLVYLNGYAISQFGYAEYSKNRDTSLISLFMKFGVLSQIFINILLFFFIKLVLNFSGLSAEANKVVLIVISGRGVGALFYILSACLYIYVRVENHEKASTCFRWICAICNIILDFLSIKFHLGIYGIILATAGSEVVELLCILFYLKFKNISFNKSRLKDIRKYLGIYVTSLFTIMATSIQTFTTGLVATRLGDELYAVYGIVYTLNAQLLWFVWSYSEVVSTLYAHREEYHLNLYKGVKTCVLRSVFLYTMFALLLTFPLVKFFAVINNIDISIYWMLFLNTFWIFVDTYFQVYEEFLRILNKYRSILVIEFLSIFLIAGLSYAFTFTNNPYITYQGWSIGYFVMILYGYVVCEKESKFFDGGEIDVRIQNHSNGK